MSKGWCTVWVKGRRKGHRKDKEKEEEGGRVGALPGTGGVRASSDAWGSGDMAPLPPAPWYALSGIWYNEEVILGWEGGGRGGV